MQVNQYCKRGIKSQNMPTPFPFPRSKSMNMADLPHSHHATAQSVSGNFAPHHTNGSASRHTLRLTLGYSRFRGVQNAFLTAVVAAAFCSVAPLSSAASAEPATASTSTVVRRKTTLMVLESPTATPQQMAARTNAGKTSAGSTSSREVKSSPRTRLRRNLQRNAQITQLALPPAMPVVTAQP
jgi:hypothetical protein